MSLEDCEIFKVILLGDMSVGKTSILLRYVENKFKENIISTIGVDFRDKIIDYGDTKIALKIWDTSGQEKYESLAQHFLRDTDGAFLVFDLTEKSSFEHIKKWLTDINDSNENVKIIILGNKSDLKDKRVVAEDIAINFAQKHNFKYFETSAKDDTNINEAFKAMADSFMENRTINRAESKHHKGSISIKKGDVNKKKKSCCK